MSTLTVNPQANKTISLMRRLSAEKKETKRQMREAFATSSVLKEVVADLDRRHAERNA